MSEPRVIAVMRGIDDVLASLRARADEIAMSRLMLDKLGKFPAGMSSKYLCDPPMRGFSLESLFSMAAALGYAIAFIDDPQSLQELARRGSKRQANAVRTSKQASMFNRRAARRVIRHFAHLGGLARAAKCGPDAIRRYSAKGGRATAKALDRATRRKIARHAAVVRWERVKAAARGDSPPRSCPAGAKP